MGVTAVLALALILLSPIAAVAQDPGAAQPATPPAEEEKAEAKAESANEDAATANEARTTDPA